MNKCKMIVQNEGSDQKIEIDFEIIDKDLNFNILFNPPLDDLKSNLGLAGQIVGTFCDMLSGKTKLNDSEIKNAE